MVVTGTVTVSLEAGSWMGRFLGAMSCDPLLKVTKDLDSFFLVTTNH